jgi:hypothetical protein
MIALVREVGGCGDVSTFRLREVVVLFGAFVSERLSLSCG